MIAPQQCLAISLSSPSPIKDPILFTLVDGSEGVTVGKRKNKIQQKKEAEAETSNKDSYFSV